MERRENSARRNENFRPQMKSLISSALSCRHLYRSINSSGLDVWLENVQIHMRFFQNLSASQPNIRFGLWMSSDGGDLNRILQWNATKFSSSWDLKKMVGSRGRFFLFLSRDFHPVSWHSNCKMSVDLSSSRGKKWGIIPARKFKKKQVRTICFLVHFWTLSNMTHILPIAYCFLFCR